MRVHVPAHLRVCTLIAGAVSLAHNDLDKTPRQWRGPKGLSKQGSLHCTLYRQGEAEAPSDFRKLLARQMVSTHSAKFRINNARLTT